MNTHDKLANDGRFIRQYYSEVVALVQPFHEAIGALGLHVHNGSPMDLLLVEMCELESQWAMNGVLSAQEDSRPRIAHCAGLADLLSKIVSVAQHPDFPKLKAHLELILGDESFVQHYVTRKENDDNNKVFELYMAMLAMLAEASIEVEDPSPKRQVRGTNPDVIAVFHGRRWGLACKALHALSIKNYVAHHHKGVDQIEKSPVDRGLVVYNLKNILPFDKFWPVQQDDGRYDYACFDDHRAVMVQVEAWVVQEIHEKIVEALGGPGHAVNAFRGKKSVPQTLNYLPIVTRCRDGQECPITKFNVFDPLKFEELDDETGDFLNALNIAANHKAEHIVRRR